MWNKDEVLNAVEEYFNKTTLEEFLKDLEETNSLQYLDDDEQV